MKTITNNSNNQKGFTLIELIIAMGLSVIILAAVGSIFLFTNNLNEAAKEEINQQQTIRNTSNLIARDASMAGYFGCLSLGMLGDPLENSMRSEFKIGRNIELLELPDPTDLTKHASLGVDWRSATDFTAADKGNISNFDALPDSNGLAFYYAQGSAKRIEITDPPNNMLIFSAYGFESDLIRTVAQNGGFLSLSSCRALHNFKVKNTRVTAAGRITISVADTGRIPTSDNTINEFNPYTMQLMRFSPVVYLAGKPTNCKNKKGEPCNNGLYRFELLANGNWAPPELMIDNVTAIDADFYYSSKIEADKIIGCPVENDDLNEFKFIKSKNSLLKADLDIQYPLLPAKLDLTINVSGADPIKITSAIQAGNICANRKIEVPDPPVNP